MHMYKRKQKEKWITTVINTISRQLKLLKCEPIISRFLVQLPYRRQPTLTQTVYER